MTMTIGREGRGGLGISGRVRKERREGDGPALGIRIIVRRRNGGT
jgi:hypothetical protein